MHDSEQAGAERAVAAKLTAVEGGERAAAEELLPLVYALLRSRARQMLAGERDGHTLTPTALVHEAYLRVAGQEAGFEGRRHFYSAAALAMRRILVEHARARGRVKRGGGAARAAGFRLDALEAAQPGTDAVDWIALDEALEELASRDPRRHRVVMLRFFAGLSEPEVAQLLGVQERTVRRDWASARVWLYSRLYGPDDSAEPLP